MKKVVFLVFIVLAVFLTVSFITGCATPPPAGEAQPQPPPPPPAATPPPAAPAGTTTAGPPPPPVVRVSYSPEYFSPDGDGYNDMLTVNINVESEAPVDSWHIQIRDTGFPFGIFSEWRGEGSPSGTIIWDGLSTTGAQLQSAREYVYTVTVKNIHDGQSFNGAVYDGSGTFQGTLQIDVLVHREEGGVLRMIVPSIVFAPDAGSLTGLDTPTMASNDWILRRIAEALQRFGTYRVKVEGHANPTTPPNTRQRTAEEAGARGEIGLRPLSEERARAVVNYLVNLGVERSRLTPVGMGGTRPVARFEDRNNWWRNRRVEFILER